LFAKSQTAFGVGNRIAKLAGGLQLLDDPVESCRFIEQGLLFLRTRRTRCGRYRCRGAVWLTSDQEAGDCCDDANGARLHGACESLSGPNVLVMPFRFSTRNDAPRRARRRTRIRAEAEAHNGLEEHAVSRVMTVVT